MQKSLTKYLYISCLFVFSIVINGKIMLDQNDKLEIKTDCIPTIYDLAIYNRWGGIVFKSKDYKEYWDGKFNGSYCTDGVYTLKLSIKYDNESFKTYTKRITLMK